MEYVSELESYKTLISAVCMQAIADWKSLGYGLLESTRTAGQTVWRKEVFGFLASSEFAAMVGFVSPSISVRAMDDRLKLRQERVQVFVAKALTEDEKEVIVKMADAGMNVSKAADLCQISRSTINRKLASIRAKTGVEPTDFWGLTRLLALIKE